MSRAERKRRFTRAQEIARETATQWWVYRRRSNGAKADRPRLVDAPNEQAALRRVRHSYFARPVLPSSAWRGIYAEVGLAQP